MGEEDKYIDDEAGVGKDGVGNGDDSVVVGDYDVGDDWMPYWMVPPLDEIVSHPLFWLNPYCLVLADFSNLGKASPSKTDVFIFCGGGQTYKPIKKHAANFTNVFEA